MAPMLFFHARLVRSVLLVAGVCFTAVGEARTHGSSSDFAHAEKQREALESKPLVQRTHAAYERVLSAYRAIYQERPADREADAAVDAVASLLAEEGRSFHDPQLLRAAIEQYEWLRRRYPASAFRQSALLSEAEIQQSDLADDVAAKQSFTRFLQMYGFSPMAGEARQQLRALERKEGKVTRAPAVVADTEDETAAEAITPAERAARNAAEHARELAELNQAQSTEPLSRHPARPVQQSALLRPTAGNGVMITGIRHWSTPVYTRVAIDLSDQVQYEAARVPNPDRIYFDFHGARLAPELVGRSLAVTDNGFLQRIRAGASIGEAGTPDSTRVVLDVSHVSEYSAFFLPNPWRLIIDIHGSVPNITGRTIVQADAVVSTSSEAQSAAASLRRAETAGGSQQEVASLAQQPSRVRATRRPTTGPIAASVSGVARAPQQNELDALAQDGSSSTAGREASTLAARPDEEAGPVAPSIVAAKKVRHATPAALPGRPSETVSTTVATGITPETPDLAAREATPTSTGERSLVRTLGLKIGRIVIDAGHGGHDSGTVGADGLQEKDVVLDVSLRLGKLLKQRLGADVIYTRDDDTFIPLETRTAIANKAQADLFVSVHANSSSDASARGVEVYYLNFTTSPEALETAARENAVSNESIYQLSDLVKKITLKDKIDESHEFAADVQTSLYSGLEAGSDSFKDRGVKKAPFVVLIGANMPSILAEISFLTNPEDARQLRDPAYRERIADSLYRGIARYVSGLSGVRLAQGTRHTTGN